MKRNQAGVGLVEVLVAVSILGIAILGFAALQVRALAESQEAGLNVQAMTLARDLSERIRMNRDGLTDYQKVDDAPTKCNTEYCTSEEMAQYDFAQVRAKAIEVGMDIDILDCQQGYADVAKRKCIYVSWGDTVPLAEEASASEPSTNACTIGTAYRPGAECVIMETYNYE